MLVVSMNSKRQRRPNVRLGEVGDVPAAFACGFSPRKKQILGYDSYENDHLLNPDFRLPDLMHNSENSNPNSDSTDMAKLKLNFGTITRKCRVMKRRRSRITNVASDVWSSKISSDERKDCSLKDFVRFSSDEFNDYVPANRSKDSPVRETSATTSKEALKFNAEEATNNAGQQWNSDEFWQGDGNDLSPVSDHVCDEMNSGGTDVNSVSRWLEEKGFGKYAGAFEMHEVDEETLPLLTLEDLKEIGVLAVGSRRKIYTAIQQMRSDVCIDDNTSE
ncbi:Sterile alpha motif (SAM) domain-containing protein [Euphorbia peplus]|nr:Sterile alpha motif (SAM) domain-containing protein [Euphorbia peplus]